jgi:hypothetical protein
LGGVAKGQLKVTVSRIADAQDKGKDKDKNALPFSCEAVTNKTGHFVFAKRLLPGDYEVRGALQHADVFTQMIQFQKSQSRFRIGPGQLRHQLQVQIPAAAK